MKALVTGIAGFIGFHTAMRLAAEGWAVCGCDNLNDYYDPALKKARLRELGKDVKVRELDIADARDFAHYVQTEKPAVIIHMAAQAGVRYSIDHPFAYAHSNLLGHLSVLEACRQAEGFSHLIYASSSSVYGGNEKVPFSETDNVDAPVSLYAATKKSDELMSATYAHLYGIKQAGLRFFTVYGPWGRPDMAYWRFTERMLKGEPIPVYNRGNMRRDFTYIDDIVSCIAAMPVALMDFIASLEKATGRMAKKQLEEMQPGDVKETYADVSRLAAEYGFKPSTDIDEGLKKFVAWYRGFYKL